jgi:hypothetical protein
LATNNVVVILDVRVVGVVAKESDTILEIKFLKKWLFSYYYILLFFMNKFELLIVVVSIESKRFLYKIQLTFASDST